MKIDKDTKIGDVIGVCPDAETILQGFGLHCISCPMSQMETLEEAAALHGADVDLMVSKLTENAKKSK